MDKSKKSDKLEEELQKIIQQKTDENVALRKLLERLDNKNSPEVNNKKIFNNIKNKS